MPISKKRKETVGSRKQSVGLKIVVWVFFEGSTVEWLNIGEYISVCDLLSVRPPKSIDHMGMSFTLHVPNDRTFPAYVTFSRLKI